jgi:hypothetical protein
VDAATRQAKDAILLSARRMPIRRTSSWSKEMAFSDPGDAVRQAKGAERMRRSARWNGMLMIVASFPLLVICISRAAGARDIVGAFALFAMLLIGGVSMRRRKF